MKRPEAEEKYGKILGQNNRANTENTRVLLYLLYTV